jgi:CotH kinase protein/Lamin Tail Domain/Chitobiase/beta-hexosaminidase C-terminal domain/Secretion system C-terminal sorting domain
MKKFQKILFFLLVIVFSGHSQGVLINEFMSANFTTIADEDGEYSDWLELFNQSASSIDLQGFYLSDDSTDLTKWTFPEITLTPSEHLLIFASGKNRTVYANHWETVFSWGDIWKYQLGTSEPPADWNTLAFNDISWSSGPSGFGYGDGDDSTVVAATNSLFLRKKFIINDLATVLQAQLHVDYDDAFVAYLNGVEIARANIGQPGIRPTYDEWASTPREALIYQGGLPEVFHIPAVQTLLQSGENVLAIQLHNYGITSSDLSLIPFFTLGMSLPPANPHGIHPLLQFSMPQLHTNFKIDAQGEPLILSDSGGNIIDRVFTSTLPADYSCGRQPDGNNQWFIFPEPTPGDSNNTTGYQGIAVDPDLDLPAGFYPTPIGVTITAGSGNSIIRYTLDGSIPQDTSEIYGGPIILDNTTVLRVRSFEPGLLPGNVITATYFINYSTTLPVMSLSTNPPNFWDWETGIYVMGPNADPNNPYFGANFWQDWERPIHIEFYEPGGNLGFQSYAGVKIFGGWSRAFPQRSLALFFRGEYGLSRLIYPLFPNKDVDEFESVVLRNSGNDWNITHFRDVLMQSLVGKCDVDIQDYRPVVVFLNGEFWGVYNLREKISKYYLGSNHDINPNNIDILENDRTVIEGDAEHYQNMLDFIASHDLSDNSNYQYVCAQMDVENFIRYEISQIYYDNTDWPGNNIRYWRPRTEDGRWRWIIYDTDFGFCLYDPNGYSHNTLEFATDPNGPEWPNPPWSTFLLRSLLQNASFRNSFINYFADYLNSYFSSNSVSLEIARKQAVLWNEMSRQFSKWGGSMANWQYNVQTMRNFASLRPAYLRVFIINKFGLYGTSQLTLQVSDTSAGWIKVNYIKPVSYPWTGIYFKGIPVRLTAVAKPGYQFAGWQGLYPADSISIRVLLPVDSTFRAIFEPDNSVSSPIVINEINYNSAADFDPEDWVELYNNTQLPVDLSGWTFKDTLDSHIFVFPTSTSLASGNYLVLCRDTAAFTALFPAVTNYLGNFNFGLDNKGDMVRLYNSDNLMIDSLLYDDELPWPLEPDGDGPTLSLKNPGLDNTLPENWAASGEHGTPGVINDVYIGIENDGAPQEVMTFKLYQNYPNPFNSGTVFRFQLAKPGQVKITIFDILGRQICEVIRQRFQAGTQQIFWQAPADLSSGVYFYNLEVGTDFKKSGKMLLLK